LLDKVATWQNRPLEAVYPVAFFDALRLNIRNESIMQQSGAYCPGRAR
jgi:putative transposase